VWRKGLIQQPTARLWVFPDEALQIPGSRKRDLNLYFNMSCLHRSQGEVAKKLTLLVILIDAWPAQKASRGGHWPASLIGSPELGQNGDDKI
jgi:hypothetical protein